MYGSREAASIAEWVLTYLCGAGKKDLLLQPGLIVSSEDIENLEQALDKLKRGMPVQYVTGLTEFYGLAFKVDKRVLIPRPETEELVRWVIDENKDRGGLDILDVGTGSGCIAISLEKNLPACRVSAVDISGDALSLAAVNARQNEAEVDFFRMDILSGKEIQHARTYDIIVSNPPYVTLAEKGLMHVNVLEHEPEGALFVPDEDPLIFYRALAEFAKSHLRPAGAIYVEINERFGREVADIFHKNELKAIEIRKDLNGRDRMVSSRKL